MLSKRSRVVLIQIVPEQLAQEAPSAVVHVQIGKHIVDSDVLDGEGQPVEYAVKTPDVPVNDAGIVQLARQLADAIAAHYAASQREPVMLGRREVAVPAQIAVER